MIPFSRVLLFVFFLAGLLPTVAAPLASPLTLTTDAIGADLQQNFIAAPGSPATASNGFIAYRKSFTLATAPASATMYLFADVRYILWINGQPVHRGPNRFVTAGPQYDAVEIGSALRSGSNTIAIVVMTNGSNAKMMSHTTGLTLRIDIAGATVVRTDTTLEMEQQHALSACQCKLAGHHRPHRQPRGKRRLDSARLQRQRLERRSENQRRFLGSAGGPAHSAAARYSSGDHFYWRGHLANNADDRAAA